MSRLHSARLQPKAADRTPLEPAQPTVEVTEGIRKNNRPIKLRTGLPKWRRSHGMGPGANVLSYLVVHKSILGSCSDQAPRSANPTPNSSILSATRCFLVA